MYGRTLRTCDTLCPISTVAGGPDTDMKGENALPLRSTSGWTTMGELSLVIIPTPASAKLRPNDKTRLYFFYYVLTLYYINDF
ncbi:Uncharacterized protein HZ326_21302 [Fusarium oxysporum f. sp. albedinis]|nr:Uncharacterized protein HZ326_21302 [Fusarium oxysporum f. sp. albedinis]